MKSVAIKTGTALALAMALSGCLSLGAGKSPAQLYTLTATTSAPSGAQYDARPVDALVVDEPNTDRGLASAHMAVQVNPTSIAYLKDAWWVERPARLLRNLLAENLRSGGQRLVQVDDDGGVGGTHLGGRLLAMGYDAHSHAAVIRYDATLSDGKGGLLMRRFEVSEPDVSPNGGDLSRGLNVAANTLATQVTQWVNQSRPVSAGAATPAP